MRSGLQHDGQAGIIGANGAGFGFTVPADTTSRTLKIWVALNRATGQLSASLSDGSAAQFIDSYGASAADEFLGAVYTLTYAAASPGQTLTVAWLETAAFCPSFGCDNVSIHAVALQGPGGGGGGAQQPGPTYTVNSSEDGSPADAGCNSAPADCTLREAIAASNASGAVDNTIVVDFDGSEITLDSPLPNIVDKVVLDGSNAQQDGDAVIVDAGATTGSGFVLDGAASNTSQIQDFHLQGFDSIGAAAIVVHSASNLIYGNAISSVATGVVVSGGAGATGNRIGTDDARGNRIWGFASAGVLVDSAGTGNLVQSNVIGRDGEGEPDAGTNGIVVQTTAGTIVGDDAGPDELDSLNEDLGNVVVGAAAEGIQIDGETTTGTVVTANLVGTDSEGTNLGNGIGIDVQSFASDNQIGPGNTVAFNGDGGIQVSNGEGNRIVANSIHSNGGAGINLFNGGNNDLAAPVLTSVTSGNIQGTVGGPDQDYFLEIFTNDSCEGAEGETYVGPVTVQDGAFNEELPVTLTDGDSVTTTLTDAITEDTSEFSNCVTVGGGDTDAPTLTGAVPLSGPALGVAGVWDSGVELAGQTFNVSFFSGSTCTEAGMTNPLGSRSELETNDGGIGAFALELPRPTPVSPGTLVAARVNGSDISNCVIADRNNVSWPTAFQVTAGVADTANYLRSSGQGRWFKVPVLANSRLTVTASNLPADYDLVVFKDIQAKYDELVTGAAEQGPNLAINDLNRQGAEAPVDVFNTSQYNPSSWDPTNWKPDLNANVFSPAYSPTEYSPTEYSAAFTSPTEYSPTEYSPTEYSPTEYSPTEYSPTEYSADQFSRDDWATFTPADPRVFSTAQTASVVAVSASAGTANETVAVNTWNNTGYFYVRVQGKNGSFDPDTPFTLQVSTQGTSCTGVVKTPVSVPPVTATNLRTLILTSSGRGLDVDALTPKLAQLAGHAAVSPAAVVDVAGPLSARNQKADEIHGLPLCQEPGGRGDQGDRRRLPG